MGLCGWEAAQEKQSLQRGAPESRKFTQNGQRICSQAWSRRDDGNSVTRPQREGPLTREGCD